MRDRVDYEPQPRMYQNNDEEPKVATFRFKDNQADLITPAAIGSARLYYKCGWSGVIFWDGSAYFADGIYTFSEMIELVSVRYGRRFEFEIEREYDETEED
jgi:hypothetical protein